MRFALVNNKRSEAKPGLNGLCPVCEQPVIAKCGVQKINHWAHKSNNSCDRWWESETEWHRSWKSYFPDDWQEYLFADEKTGEKHIADIHTEQGLIIEFQHSSIKPEERISREKFYKNMIWVVDGTNSKNDHAYKRFLKGIDEDAWDEGRDQFSFIHNTKEFFWCDSPESFFPKNWLQSPAPVIFDFLGLKQVTDSKDPRKPLYYMYPQRIRGNIVFAMISRKNFINLTINGNFSDTMSKHLNDLNQKEIEYQRLQEKKQRKLQEQQKKQELVKQQLLKEWKKKQKHKPIFSSTYDNTLPWAEAYYKGEDAFKKGDFCEANHSFKRALELNTYQVNQAFIKKAIAKTCKKLGHYDEAHKCYIEILQKNPDDMYTKVALAAVFRQKKDYINSINLYESVLKKEPNNEHARTGLAAARKEYELSKEQK